MNIDIALGYEDIDIGSIGTNDNVQNVLSQINAKYQLLIKNKTLTSISEL